MHILNLSLRFTGLSRNNITGKRTFNALNVFADNFRSDIMKVSEGECLPGTIIKEEFVKWVPTNESLSHSYFSTDNGFS